MQNEHLTKAAEIIIAKMQNPANFLSFLIEAQRWYNGFIKKYPPKDEWSDHTHSISDMIEFLVIPWMNSEKTPVEAVSEGLSKIVSFEGHEGYCTICSEITQAFGFDLLDGIPTVEFYTQYLNGINILMEVSHYLGEYEMTKKGDRRAA